MEFLARQEGLAGCSKLVFLKTLAKPVATDPTFIELFLNKARIAARLSHPNIVQIYELGEVNGEYFIAMEHVHGHHLGAVLDTLRAKAQSFSPVLAAQLCTQVLRGLRYAHTLEDEQGRPLHLVHKNVCPANVLLGFSGAVKIYNFGIPFLKAGNRRTLYVAPEQCVDGKIDARVDVYATGALLAELLLGKFPRHCRDGQQLVQEVVQHPELPFALADIISCALAPKRDDRFESAREMVLALEHYVEAAGASQVTVELANFLCQLFGHSTNSNPWLSYEEGFLNNAVSSSVSAAHSSASQLPSPSPSASPSLPPSPVQASPAEESKESPWEVFQMQETLWEILPMNFKYILGSLLLAGVLGGIVGWLFQT